MTNTLTWTAASAITDAGGARHRLTAGCAISREGVTRYPIGTGGEAARQLPSLAENDADGERQDGRIHAREEEHAENHADVLHGRGDGGREEAAVGVEGPHGEGAQTDEGQVRKHDTGEKRGQGGLSRVPRKARRHHAHDPRREDDAEDGGHR